jgi:hypothetical protein
MDDILESNPQKMVRSRSPNSMFVKPDNNESGFSNRRNLLDRQNRFSTAGEKDTIDEIAMKIFIKYDKDRSGFLDKKETLKMLDDILMN